MYITCPQCRLNGEIAGGAPAAFKLRVVCANCATVLIISVVNDEMLIMTVKPPADTSAAAEALPAEPPRSASIRERLALAGTPPQVSSASAFSTPDDSKKAPGAAATAAVAGITLPAEALLLPPPPPYPPLQGEAGVPFDAYSTGARALRVSPLWLLAGGMAAVVFVIFCNWLLRSGTLPRRNDAAVNLAQVRMTPRDAAAANGNDAARDVQRITPPNALTAADASPAGNSSDATSPAAQTTPPSEMRPAPPSTGETATAVFTVQLGAFNTPAEAQALIDQLAAAGFSAWLDAQTTPRRKIWYRVQSGRFDTHDEAAAYGQQLITQNAISTFIVAKATVPNN